MGTEEMGGDNAVVVMWLLMGVLVLVHRFGLYGGT